VKIDYQGTIYDFDFTRLTVGECEEIEKFTGAKGLGDWSNQLQAANTKALQAVWWVMQRQSGLDPGPIGRRDTGLLPLALNAAIGAAERAELEAQLAAEMDAADAEDPTVQAGGSPRRGGRAGPPPG